MARGLAAYSCGGSPGVSPEFPFHLLAENLSQGGLTAKVGAGSMWGVMSATWDLLSDGGPKPLKRQLGEPQQILDSPTVKEHSPSRGAAAPYFRVLR